VEADARLVEDVQHADEPAADLPGEADALRLAARERRGGAVERQVVEADVQQETEAGADFLQQLAGDRFRHVGQLRLVAVEPRDQLADGRAADFDERLAADADRPGLRVQALAVAVWAADLPHVLFEPHPLRAGGGLLELRQQLRDDPLPLPAVLPHRPVPLLPLPDDVPVTAAVQQQLALLDGELVPRRLQVDVERLRDALIDVLPPPPHALERADQRHGAGVEAERRVGHD
jgi:hypothetical protein